MIQKGWRLQSIEGCGWSGVVLMCVCTRVRCVVCGVVSRTRFRKGKKKRVLSLSLWGCCVQCNLAKFGRGRCKIPKVWRSFPWADSGGNTLPYSRKLPRQAFGGVCSQSQSKSQQRQYQQVAVAVRCGTVRYGTVRHSTVRPSIAQYTPSSACPGGWFWYGKYLAGQPGRLLDQVLISLAGLVNLKRKKPQDNQGTMGRDGWSP